MPGPARPPLRVVVDGAQMPEAEARAFWERFSAHMDEHRGDLAGFAAKEGLTSVHPEVSPGGPLLVASKTAPQKPYANARSGSGSDVPQSGAGGRPGERPHAGQNAGKKRRPR